MLLNRDPKDHLMCHRHHGSSSEKKVRIWLFSRNVDLLSSSYDFLSIYSANPFQPCARLPHHSRRCRLWSTAVCSILWKCQHATELFKNGRFFHTDGGGVSVQQLLDGREVSLQYLLQERQGLEGFEATLQGHARAQVSLEFINWLLLNHPH